MVRSKTIKRHKFLSRSITYVNGIINITTHTVSTAAGTAITIGSNGTGHKQRRTDSSNNNTLISSAMGTSTKSGMQYLAVGAKTDAATAGHSSAHGTGSGGFEDDVKSVVSSVISEVLAVVLVKIKRIEIPKNGILNKYKITIMLI